MGRKYLYALDELQVISQISKLNLSLKTRESLNKYFINKIKNKLPTFNSAYNGKLEAFEYELEKLAFIYTKDNSEQECINNIIDYCERNGADPDDILDLIENDKGAKRGAKFKWKLDELKFIFHIVNLNPSKKLKEYLSLITGIEIIRKFSQFKKLHLNEKVDLVHELEEQAFKETRNASNEDSLNFVFNYCQCLNLDIINLKERFENDTKGSFWWSDASRMLALACAVARPPVSLKNEIANILYTNFERPFDNKVTLYTNYLKEDKDIKLGKKDTEFIESNKEISFEKALNHITDYLKGKSKNFDELMRDYQIQLDRKDYEKAIQRWKSLRDRSFERYLSELCLKYYFIDNDFEFTYIDPDDEKGKEEVKRINIDIVNENFFSPKITKFSSHIDFFDKNSELIREFYTEKTKVMAFNVVFDHWISKIKEKDSNIREYNLLKDAFEVEFNKQLPLEWFYKEFFGKDEDERCCRYCEMTESEMLEMNELDLFLTKRLYVKGKSMEIDQLNAYKGYSKDNIALVCYWCNNAKTDEFSDLEFKRLGKVIKDIWQDRRNKTLNKVV